MSCSVKRIKHTRICAADLREQIDIVRRVLTGITPGDLGASPVEFEPVASGRWAGIETVQGTSRFSGVNINPKATHLFYIRYDPDLSIQIESGNNFVRFEGRNMRVLEVTLFNEQKEFTIIQCTERGEGAASQA
jgi:head-tail adaptor